MATKDSLNKTNYKLEVNRVIDDFFKENIAKASLIDSHYQSLWNELHTLINAGGKRIRSQMTIMVYEAFGGTNVDTILPVAAAQELLHMSMLIHDDIIDRDTTRYGVDNITGTYEKLYAEQVIDKDDLRHYAQSAALLAGDLLISATYQLIGSASITARKILAVQHLFGKSIFEVAGGELLDTESVFRPLGEIDAKTIAYYKTASYTFVGPLMTGALLANASIEDQIQLSLFAEYLGIAYQLKDDLISVFGNEEITGKSSTSDLREGKKTFLVEKFFKLASKEQIKQFKTYFGLHSMTSQEIQILKELLIASQAKKAVEDSIDRYVQKANNALLSLNLTQERRETLDNFIAISILRDK
jgi:geranylgeranyl pyrophosphate synthase